MARVGPQSHMIIYIYIYIYIQIAGSGTYVHKQVQEIISSKTKLVLPYIFWSNKVDKFDLKKNSSSFRSGIAMSICSSSVIVTDGGRDGKMTFRNFHEVPTGEGTDTAGISIRIFTK